MDTDDFESNIKVVQGNILNKMTSSLCQLGRGITMAVVWDKDDHSFDRFERNQFWTSKMKLLD